MTPKQFLEEICAPTVAEFENNPASLRRAWVAVVALFHFCDYLAAARAVRLGDVRAEVLREFPRFAWIEEVANAYPPSPTRPASQELLQRNARPSGIRGPNRARS
jgi:hypothetical protein